MKLCYSSFLVQFLDKFRSRSLFVSPGRKGTLKSLQTGRGSLWERKGGDSGGQSGRSSSSGHWARVSTCSRQNRRTWCLDTKHLPANTHCGVPTSVKQFSSATAVTLIVLKKQAHRHGTGKLIWGNIFP